MKDMNTQSNVRKYFEAKGVRAVDFSDWVIRNKDSKLSYFTARRVVAGETDISLGTALLLREFLETPLDELFPPVSGMNEKVQV